MEVPLLRPWQSVVTLGATGYGYIEAKTAPCSAYAAGEKFGFDTGFLIVPLSLFSPGLGIFVFCRLQRDTECFCNLKNMQHNFFFFGRVLCVGVHVCGNKFPLTMVYVIRNGAQNF